MEAAERSDIKQLPQGISLEVFRLKTEWKGHSSKIKKELTIKIPSKLLGRDQLVFIKRPISEFRLYLLQSNFGLGVQKGESVLSTANIRFRVILIIEKWLLLTAKGLVLGKIFLVMRNKTYKLECSKVFLLNKDITFYRSNT